MRTAGKVAIIGGSIWGNRGAAAMLETTIAQVRAARADVRIAVFTPYPQKDAALAQDDSLEFYDSRPQALVKYFVQALWVWLRRKLGGHPQPQGALGAMDGAEALLDVGGITFADGRLIFLPYNILTLWPAMLMGTPVVKLSQAAGSFRNPLIRWAARIFLPRCAQTFARGEKTYAYLRELGLSETQVQPATDAAFLYAPSYCLSNENETALRQVCEKLYRLKAAGVPVVAISPSVLVMEKSGSSKIDYHHVLLGMMEGCGSSQAHFVVFPNASRERSKKSRNNDIIAIERLRAEAELSLPRPLLNRITWMMYDVNTRGIDEIVRRADVLVTSRFHAMVFGLRLCVPTLVIGWGHKYLEAMQRFHLEPYVFDYREASKDLSQVLTEMLAHSQEIHEDMLTLVGDVQRSSEVQFAYLRGLLLEPPNYS